MALIDDFNRGAIGANWTGNAINDTGANIAITGSTTGTCGALTYCQAYYNVQTFPRDLRIGVTLVAGGGATKQLDISARLATPATAGVDGYLMEVSGTALHFFRIDNSTPTELGVSDTVTALAAGEFVEFVLTGSTLQMFRNGAPAGTSRTDSTYLSPGYVGLGGFDNAINFDDFSVSSIDTYPESVATAMFARRRRRIV